MPKAGETGRQSLVVFAKNKRRVSAFYQKTLGLRPAVSQPSHDVLRARGIEIVIHGIPRKYAADIKIAKPPKPRDETPFKPAFYVADLERVRKSAVACGGYLKPRDGAWHIRGATVLDGWDPEGNIVQFKQMDE